MAGPGRPFRGGNADGRKPASRIARGETTERGLHWPLPRIRNAPKAVSRADVHDDLSLGQREASAIAPALIRRELDRITSSKAFQPSRRHQKLLRHLVEQAIAGQTAALKEPVLALEVFERPLAGFDPARDTIVRVEATKLRRRLGDYYGGAGAADGVSVGRFLSAFAQAGRSALPSAWPAGAAARGASAGTGATARRSSATTLVAML